KIEDPGIVEIVEKATAEIKPDLFIIKEEGATKSSSGTAYMMSIFMLTILFSVLMGYGQLIMRGVIEEKNNRIVEVLISSTNTQSLFYGKIIGIGLAGLTQVGIWMIMGWLLMGKFSLGIDKSILNFLSLELGIYFVIFFIIGYFMYSILFSIVGASVNTDQEAQQYAAPITYLLIIPFMIGIMVTQNPNTPLVVGTSLFPLFTPTLMFMRISVATPAFSQILLSIFTSLGFTILLAWFGAKIFRVGILMYGKKPSIKEIIKWIRYK
ncbi:MAG: ABC transporter permease, partial [Candidatus Aminicenantes bacterium]|nr:ABC transporter permease [Candidatus Aminicenantes bacterium]